MKILLLISLVLSIDCSYAYEDKQFKSKKECREFCYAEFDRMLKAEGLDNVSIEEDVGSYIAQIRFKTDMCLKHCKFLKVK